MVTQLRLLIVEDSEDDAMLIVHRFERAGYRLQFKRVETQEAFDNALEEEHWDIIISDYKMPHFSGLVALEMFNKKGFDIPFIIVSGTIGEELAVKAMKTGAHDYVMKDNMSRLIPAVQRELREADSRRKRKQVEQDLKASEEKYRTIFENAMVGIFQSTPDGRIINANPALARIHGYDSAEEFIEQVKDVRKTLYVNPDDRNRIVEMLENQYMVVDFETQFYRKNKEVIWVDMNVKAKRNEQGDIVCYEGIVEDITSRKKAEQELKTTLEKLRKSLAGTIQAMSLTVETRDPYTAGHQRRVSGLAVAIAHELDLPDDTIDNIRMAGNIHDIGKISIPAEILSKPVKLTDVEMSLIKTHSQSGYEILKDVGLPYPIAEVVLQHHERLDGSGYPRGLKSDQILLETRILSVADVVEAIATHRPYRPALGIGVALSEIEKNRGTLYDSKVVDLCIKLFREQGFVLD